MAETTTSRSKRYLEKLGYMVGSTERWVEQTKRRVDLFGFIDLLAVHNDRRENLAVQATSGSNGPARVRKIWDTPKAGVWLRAGNRIEVHAWRKVKLKRGGKAVRWEPRITEVTLEQWENAQLS